MLATLDLLCQGSPSCPRSHLPPRPAVHVCLRLIGQNEISGVLFTAKEAGKMGQDIGGILHRALDTCPSLLAGKSGTGNPPCLHTGARWDRGPLADPNQQRAP